MSQLFDTYSLSSRKLFQLRKWIFPSPSLILNVISKRLKFPPPLLYPITNEPDRNFSNLRDLRLLNFPKICSFLKKKKNNSQKKFQYQSNYKFHANWKIDSEEIESSSLPREIQHFNYITG